MAEIDQIVTEVVIDDSKATAGADRVVSAFRKLEGASVTVTGAQTSAQRSVDRWAAAASPAEAAMQKLAKAETDLSRAVRQGIIDQERQAQILGGLQTRLGVSTAANNNLAAAVGRMRPQIQQAGYQIGDFATQVASGTNPMIAFTQQATQLLGVFGGPWGAVIGAAVGILGALAVKFLDVGDAASSAGERAQAFQDAIEAGNRVLMTHAQLQAIDQQKQVKEAIDLTTESLRQQEAELRNLERSERMAQGFGPRAIGQVVGDRANRLEPLRAEIATTRTDLAKLQQQLADLNDPTKLFPEDPKEPKGKRKSDADRAREEAIRQEQEFGRALDGVMARIDPVGEASRQLANDQGVLFGAMARGIEVVGGYAVAFDKLEAAYRDKLDPTGAALRKLTEAQDLQRAALDAEAAAIGMTADQRAVYLAGLQAEAALKKANIPATAEGASAYVSEARAIEQARKEQERLKGQLVASEGAAQQLVGTMSDGFGEAARSIANAGFNLQELGDIGERVLNQLIDAFVELAYMNPLNNALGLNGGNAPTLATVGPQILGMFGNLFGGNAALNASIDSMIAANPSIFENGGIMTPRGPMPLNRYEWGGVADSPQVAIYGEGRRPEAYVPLPDGRTIPVTMRMGSGANDDRTGGTSSRVTNNFRQTFNLPPQANGFGRSPQQQAGMLTERMMRSLRNTG